MRISRRPVTWSLILAGAVVLLVLPSIGVGTYWQREITLIAIYGLVVLGLNVSHGYAGELALGQAAILASGAYAAGIIALRYTPNLLVGLLAGGAAAAVVGLVSGIPGIRLGAWSLAMISFFLVVLLPDVLNLFPGVTGGQIGLVGIPQPTLFGSPVGPEALYYTAVLVATAWLLLIRSFVRSRHGDALRVLADNPVLARSLGMSVPRAKVLAYVVGSIPAGFAGALFAYLQQYLSASAFDLDLTLAFLAASVIGGSQGMIGAFVGAAVLELGPMQSTAFQNYSILTYGLFMLAGGLLLTGALTGVGKKLRAAAGRRVGAYARGGDAAECLPDNAVTTVDHRTHDERVQALTRLELAGRMLGVRGVSKSFGGQTVLRDVSLTALPSTITAIIGPNGSGKTTLLNAISGFVRPDAGSISLDDHDIVGSAAHRIARLGIARTFQTPSVPPGLTAHQVVATARFVKPYVGAFASALRLPSYRRAHRQADRAATEALEAMGLSRFATSRAAALPLGTRRLLEVARAIAAAPAVVLLDEPASGLDEDAIAELSSAITALRDAGATIVLIEHNFPLVLQIADRINVLALGEVVASGSPAEIREHPVVLESYLGRRDRSLTGEAQR